MTDNTRLPKDRHNDDIQVVRPKTPHQITIAAASSENNSTAFNRSTIVISLYSPDTDLYIKQGNTTSAITTASAHRFPSGQLFYISNMDENGTGYQYLKTLGTGIAGTLFVSEQR